MAVQTWQVRSLLALAGGKASIQHCLGLMVGGRVVEAMVVVAGGVVVAMVVGMVVSWQATKPTTSTSNMAELAIAGTGLNRRFVVNISYEALQDLGHIHYPGF